MTNLRLKKGLFLIAMAGSISVCRGDDWKIPANAPLLTRWAREVSPTNALPEYPRPQLVRKDWLNLNGLWEFQPGIGGQAVPVGQTLSGKILVPFPIESALSGVMAHHDEAWYRREFSVPPGWKGRHLQIHFGAVNWESEIFINGKSVGTHKGGYDAFSFDITPYLKPGGPQELLVRVINKQDIHLQAMGKQHPDPHGFWYTVVSGIWQTVWLEPLPERSIESLKLTPDVDAGKLNITAQVQGDTNGLTVEVEALDGKTPLGVNIGQPSKEFSLTIPKAKLWSPDSPFLYGLTVALKRDGKIVDSVTSYFGMRKITIDRTGAVPQILLNGKRIYQAGILDQGWWPDGLYTALTDEALKWDIQAEEDLGFNMVRKHIKVEPARWYYWADKLGILVWQDMPSRQSPRDPAGDGQFEIELQKMVNSHDNSPSIVTWIIFNEAWGMYDVDRLSKLVKDLDPTRLVTQESGSFDSSSGDLNDIHNYPAPTYPRPTNKPRVLGEHGVGPLVIPGHTWIKDHNETTPLLKNGQDLLHYYTDFVDQTRSYILTKGLCASIYTQITDVERENNGLYTYDREIAKVDVPAVRSLHQSLIHADPEKSTYYIDISESSERFGVGQPWLYTTADPGQDWTKPSFPDASWSKGIGGFGGVDNDRIHTKVPGGEVWIRKDFSLNGIAPDQLKNFRLRVRYVGAAEYYINGVLAFTGTGDNWMYRYEDMSEAARVALVPNGKNVIAAHVKRPGDRSWLDLGIVYRKTPGDGFPVGGFNP
jgi:hypothetical protein